MSSSVRVHASGPVVRLSRRNGAPRRCVDCGALLRVSNHTRRCRSGCLGEPGVHSACRRCGSAFSDRFRSASLHAVCEECFDDLRPPTGMFRCSRCLGLFDASVMAETTRSGTGRCRGCGNATTRRCMDDLRLRQTMSWRLAAAGAVAVAMAAS